MRGKAIIIIIFALALGSLSLFFLKNKIFPPESNDLNLECDNCNLIVISLTNTRKDHIGAYGYGRGITPNIDNFFDDSLIFNNAFSPSPWTLPNGASLFTSLYPYSHNVVSRYDGSKISENQKTFAEILKNLGYKTAAFTGGGDYNRAYGFNRGFEEYDDANNFSGITDNKDKIISWLNKNNKEKFFLFIQGFDTHCPFNPPAPYDEKYKTSDSNLDSSICYWNLSNSAVSESGGAKIYEAYRQNKERDGYESISLNEGDKQKLIDLYDGEINFADNTLGEIFKKINDLKLDKNTIVVFLSEHGDLIGDNGRFMRTDILGTFTDSVLNIPLFMRYPKVNNRKELNGLVGLVDIAPTVLDLLGADFGGNNFQGKSLLPMIEYGEIINDYVFAGLKYKTVIDNPFLKDVYEANMIRSLRYKLITEKIFNSENGTLKKENHEFYDIDKDPTELINIINDKNNKGPTDEFDSRLLQWLGRAVK